MTAEAALRQRVESLDTHALLAMWRTHEREPWAEAILRETLESRGVARDQLNQDKLTRSEVQQATTNAPQTVIGFFMVGRFLAGFFAIASFNIVGGIMGLLAGQISVVVIFATYILFLVRHLLRMAREPSKPDLVTFGMALMWIEAAFVGLVVVTLVALLLGWRATAS